LAAAVTVFGTPVPASARWRPMERSRNCPTHPPLSWSQRSSDAIVAAREVFRPPTPRSRAKPQGGRVGEACVSSAAPAANVRWHQRQSPRQGRHAWPGRTGRGGKALHDGVLAAGVAHLAGTTVAPKARWRPMWQLRRHPHPPAPKAKAIPQGGRVGKSCLSRAPLAAKVRRPQRQPPWQGRHARPGHAATGGTGLHDCILAPDVALLLDHLSLPELVGRQRGTRETAPPTRPHKDEPSSRAGGWERQASGAAPAARVRWEWRAVALEAPGGHRRCPIVGAALAAKAHWRPLRCSRDCPTHPPLSLPELVGRQ
jgi:hypothetical protein